MTQSQDLILFPLPGILVTPSRPEPHHETSHVLAYSIVKASWWDPGVLPGSRCGGLWLTDSLAEVVLHLVGFGFCFCRGARGRKSLCLWCFWALSHAWSFLLPLRVASYETGPSGTLSPLLELGPRMLLLFGYRILQLCIWCWPLELSLFFLHLDEWFGFCLVWQRLWVFINIHVRPRCLAKWHFPAFLAVRNGCVAEYRMVVEMRGATSRPGHKIFCGERPPSRRSP